MIYLIIFFAKLVEVTLATLRMVFITKGRRNIGTFIAVFEIVIWAILTGTVVNGIIEDPLKIVVYALGFATGCYFGSWLEEKIALGVININIITNEKSSNIIAQCLKRMDVGYTILDANGQKNENKLIIAYFSRNKKKQILLELNKTNEHFFITTNESVGVIGGYGLKR